MRSKSSKGRKYFGNIELIICDNCWGKKKVNTLAGYIKCPICKGKGKLKKRFQHV